jgi:hypothetical protein
VDLNILNSVYFMEKILKKRIIVKRPQKTSSKEKKSVFKRTLTNQLSLQDIYTKIEANNNSSFSNELFVAICWAESSFKPDSVSGSSTSKGLMMMNEGAVDIVNSNTPSGVHFEYDDMFNPDLAIACGT